MLLGRVIGNVVCTMKNASLTGQKLLIVQPIDRRAETRAAPSSRWIPLAQAQAKRFTGAAVKKPASRIFREPPTDATIVGIVDAINIRRRVSK